jgi:glycosyltransferase involved in cell wall biosynthesis
MEVPVVASDVRGNADLVDDGCGRLVPPGDPRALAEAAAELLALRPHERRRMGAAGRAKMIREFRPRRLRGAVARRLRPTARPQGAARHFVRAFFGRKGR